MKTLLLIVCLLGPVVASAAIDPIHETQRKAKLRIDTLLGQRRSPQPAATAPANPFDLPQAATLESDSKPTQQYDAPVTKADTLARLAASLNVTGFVQIQSVPHLIINRQAYHEDDLIPIRDANGSVTFVRLKTITTDDFTLELEDIEVTQKHTVK